MKAKNIVWATDGFDVEELNLPQETFVPLDIDEDEIADYLSDRFGFLVESFEL